MNSGQWLPSRKGMRYSFKSPLASLTCRAEGKGESYVRFGAQGKLTFPVFVEQRASYHWDRWCSPVKAGVPARVPMGVTMCMWEGRGETERLLQGMADRELPF